MATKIPNAIADLELSLSTAISVGTTSFTLSSATDDDGEPIPAGLYCFTLDSGTSNKEYLIGQVNGTAVTSVKSVSRQGVETTGAVRPHRIGAPCILTDFATIQRVADVLNGDLALDGASPLIYDAEPTLSDNKELATVGYVLSVVTGGTVSFDAQTITGNAGEAIVAGNLVYFKTSDQEWYKTDADTATTIEGVQLGIALGTGSDGVAISGGIQISGTYTTTGLTAGSLYYVSATAGDLSATAAGRQVGVALSTTKLLLIPETAVQRTTGVPIGSIIPFAGVSAPTNYLLAQGQAVSRATYAILFSVLGTVYGVGNGSTTFNLPNLQGRVPVGLDTLQTEFDTLGETGGAKTHTLSASEMPAHTHTVASQGSTGGSTTSIMNANNLQGAFTQTTTSSAGSGTAHNNLQPYINLNYIVRAL